MEKHNILIIYTDQLKKSILSCYGGTDISTPNIDYIASNGAKSGNFFTPSAVCTPSRGCFMTGLYPHKHKAYRNGVSIHTNAVGFASVFSKNGYDTIYDGKWHLSGNGSIAASLENVNSLGFDIWANKIEFGHCKNAKLESKNDLVLSTKISDNKDEYVTDFLTNRFISFIKEHSSNSAPFLYMMSLPDPHQPFRVRKPYDTMFDPLSVSVPNTFYEEQLPDWAEKDEWGRHHYFPMDQFERNDNFRRMKAQYLGLVKCIDDNVGRVIAALKENNLISTTYVIFTTDHGDYLGEHGLMEKNNLYDSVYNVPFLIMGPSINKNTKIDEIVSVLDIPNTLTSLANIPCDLKTDGRDISTLFKGGKLEDEEIFLQPSDVPRAGIITREWQLCYVGESWKKDRVFSDHILFNRIEDPEQTNNLFKNEKYKTIVEELRQKMVMHFKMHKTPLENLPKEVWP